MPARWCRGMNDSSGIAGVDVARRVILKGCGRCCYRPVLAKAGLYVHARIFIVGCSLQSDLWIFRMGRRIRCQVLEPGLGCRAAAEPKSAETSAQPNGLQSVALHRLPWPTGPPGASGELVRKGEEMCPATLGCDCATFLVVKRGVICR